jgi:hypothetical protein
MLSCPSFPKEETLKWYGRGADADGRDSRLDKANMANSFLKLYASLLNQIC